MSIETCFIFVVVICLIATLSKKNVVEITLKILEKFLVLTVTTKDKDSEVHREPRNPRH
jgi:hypothetical protein